jgi:hypothetical protein
VCGFVAMRGAADHTKRRLLLRGHDIVRPVEGIAQSR